MTDYADHIRPKITATLNDPVIGKINFSLQGAPVDGTGLREIGRLVQLRKIGVSVDPTLQSGAEYDVDKNLFIFSSSTPNKRTIVHEATHALLDHRKCRDTTKLTHEVAGFLAELLFALQKAPIQARQRLTNKSYVRGTYAHILQEALKVIDQHQMLTKSVVLRWGDYQDLRNTIHTNPTYKRLGKMETYRRDI